MITKFAIPEVISGHGSIEFVAKCALRLGAKRVFFVSDNGLEQSGWVDRVLDILDGNDLPAVYFDKVSSNPRDYQVHEGADLYARERCDVIIALGGGSPMDAAKGIGTLVGNGGRIGDFEGANRIMCPLPPMILIPSTAGSGSDVSQFCIITDVEREVKMSIISRSLVPNISIIDPDLLLSKDADLILASAIDAMAHAVESYVSKLATPITRMHSHKAIELIVKNIQPAVEDKDTEALRQLSIASTSAGMAFSNAGLGVLHSIAHSLGGMYDVLHGMVHPVLLPSVMRFNMRECTETMGTIGRIIAGARLCSDQQAALAGIDKLEELFASLGVNQRLRDLLPDQSSIEQICRVAIQDVCSLTNPRESSWRDLRGICEEAW